MVSSTRWSDTNYISVLCNNSTPSASYRKMLKYAGRMIFYYIYLLLHDIGIPIWLKQLTTNLRLSIICRHSYYFFYIVGLFSWLINALLLLLILKKYYSTNLIPKRIPRFGRDYLSSIADKYLDKYKWFKAVYQDALFPYFRANSFLKTCHPLDLISLCLRR